MPTCGTMLRRGTGGITRIGRFDDPIDLVKAQTGFFHATIERAS